MRFELFKILDKKYVDDFQNGKLFMNTIDYFRGQEDNEAQSDWGEGICGAIHKNQAKQLNINIPESLHKVMKSHLTLRSNYYGLNNIFCMYRVMIDDANKLVQKPSQNLYKFNGENSDEKVVIHITDTDEFLRRVNVALNDNISAHEIEYGIYGSVTYNSAWTNADGPGTRSAFQKDPIFSYQNEWRLCVLSFNQNRAPLYFEIGNLSDIIEVISLHQFIFNTKSLYPSYQMSEDPIKDTDVPLNILGSLNAISKFMYSYTGLPQNKPIRSDLAQANWHYTQYLELSGKKEEIDNFLYEQMRANHDLDHLWLLVNYRMSQGELEKAASALMFFYDHYPSVVDENVDDFCFALHSVFMKLQEPINAAKFYYTSSKQYSLNKDLQQTMLSDILLSLGFYDKALPIFNEMKKTSNDPIIDYYLAISHLHLLNFDLADKHLQNAEHYFSQSTQLRQKISELRMIIDCFLNDSPLAGEFSTHNLSDISWTNEAEDVLSKLPSSSIAVPLLCLYQITKFNKWELLNKFSNVYVCTITICDALRLYFDSNDIIFFKMIDYISHSPQINILSPELETYLAVDISEPNLTDEAKMLQAIYTDMMYRPTP